MAGILARFTASTIDAAGTHVAGQATYYDKGGNSNTFNTSSIALGLTAFATNLLVCASIAADCNTNYGTSYTMLDVALTGGFDTL